MNSSKGVGGGEEVLFPVTISVRADTVRLLYQMASDMGISIDDVLSVLAEDAAIDLENEFQTIIPDKCSKEDLLNAID